MVTWKRLKPLKEVRTLETTEVVVASIQNAMEASRIIQ
jgi:hypothetical protein